MQTDSYGDLTYEKSVMVMIVLGGCIDPAGDTKTTLVRRVLIVAPWILKGIVG
jgi:hypothetical protein